MQARSEKRYDDILDTAANLFMDKGFNSTTTNEIARQAGFSIEGILGSILAFHAKYAAFRGVILEEDRRGGR